jgi:hypothetical protein
VLSVQHRHDALGGFDRGVALDQSEARKVVSHKLEGD